MKSMQKFRGSAIRLLPYRALSLTQGQRIQNSNTFSTLTRNQEML